MKRFVLQPFSNPQTHAAGMQEMCTQADSLTHTRRHKRVDMHILDVRDHYAHIAFMITVLRYDVKEHYITLGYVSIFLQFRL